MFLKPKKINFILILMLASLSIQLCSMEKEEKLSPNELLLHSAENADLEGLREAIQAGANINAQDGSGYTAVALAIRFNNLKVVNELLARGADVNIANDWGVTPLMFAADDGNYNIVKLLVAAGADVNAKDDRGVTVLHGPSFHGDLEIVKFLILHGANVNAYDENGYSALDVAIQNDERKVIKYLVAAGADTSKYEKEQSQMMRDIDEQYADDSDLEEREDIGDEEGQYGQFDEYESEPENISDYGSEEIEKFPVSREEFELYGDIFNEAGEFKSIEQLIEEGKEIFRTIFEAAKNRDYKKLKEFIDQGYTLNIRDEFGNTPLHWIIRKAAAQNDNDLNMILLILEQPYAQILLHAKNINGHTPVHLAIEKQRILSLLIARGFSAKK